jgi:hypothetical protein
MTQSFSSLQSTQSPAPPYGAAIYTHPSDVTNDPKLTISEKRVVLASWIVLKNSDFSTDHNSGHTQTSTKITWVPS